MNKATEVVKTIGDRLIDELFKLDNDISYEPDPEFGGFEASYSAPIYWKYGEKGDGIATNIVSLCSGIDIDCTVTWPYHDCANIEVILYGSEGIHEKRYKKLDRLQEAVQAYLDEHLDIDSLLSNMQDKLREASMDEWEEHGFRDAADYHHYRYG